MDGRTRWSTSGVLEPVELEDERVPSPTLRRGLLGSRIRFRNNGVELDLPSLPRRRIPLPLVVPLPYHRKDSTLSFAAAAIVRPASASPSNRIVTMGMMPARVPLSPGKGNGGCKARRRAKSARLCLRGRVRSPTMPF
ncbi:hypothetical protein C4D60_Mb01t18410 [Musa balbisiana]|uniref:Uncharacterized protein n=1 Tax=Musa balbisiana TaxID=52838 RepID=A0A4S8JN34_MUSBA|nr:hypothetical protein C4D60_Mb01t18410 [Musa balbisiana]